MKRLISILLVVAMLLALAGCNKPKKGTPADNNDSPNIMHTPMSFNGVSIQEYQIVCDQDGLDYNLRAAEYIRNAIASVTGYSLTIVDDSAVQNDHEIVVGETTRAISRELNQPMPGVKFSMLTKNGSVALEGNYFVIAAAAYYFVFTYVRAGEVTIADETLVRDPIVKEAKNYILLIGDGMGVYQTMMYDYLEDKSDYSDGEQLFYGYMLPNFGLSRTDSFSGTTDSAAGGTAMATGYKTLNGYVGMDRNGNELKSLTELSAELGKSTAILTTDAQTGATPSAFTAHENDRYNSTAIRGDQANLIAQIGTVVESGFDYYNARYMATSIEKRMTDTLSKVGADSDGFFLMYEEAHIDKHCDDMDLEKSFLAVIRFNQAIARFMEYAFYNPDTVVIITADHETGGLAPSEVDGMLHFATTEHTNSPVPVFAWGYGTEYFNNAIIDNIQIAHFISSSMGVDSFGDRTNGWYSEIYPNELPVVPV